TAQLRDALYPLPLPDALPIWTKVIAYDPFVQPARAAQLGVEMTTLDDLLRRSDFITIHLPKNKDTLGLISDEAFEKVKPSVRVRSEEHTSELQSRFDLVCRLL